MQDKNKNTRTEIMRFQNYEILNRDSEMYYLKLF